jgi:rare lipoprotein A
MPVSDRRSLFSRVDLNALFLRGGSAVTLAACFLCTAVVSGNAASTSPVEIAATPFLAPVVPVAVNATAATFASRFDFPQTPAFRDIMGAIERAPMLPQKTVRVPREQQLLPAGPAIVGTASTYNPSDETDSDAGNQQTASGELYDPNGWTAAIRTDLRDKFGGVRFGKNYRPTFALVQTSDKQVIVRINDVGKLKPGRIIDLNERVMRYFDPTLQLGLIENVSVTPLTGQNFVLGPIFEDQPVTFASRFDSISR